jgi:hydrogenase maturation protein HypF
VTRAPRLVLAIGNPSRGDDALGPMLLARAEVELAAEVAAGAVELLTDFQLQIEHALDLTDREDILFVDASVRVPAPCAVEPLAAAPDASISSHALSPAAVLETHRRVVGPPPPARVLAIRGEFFELGEPLSAAAELHLEAAVGALTRHFGHPDTARALQIRGTVQGVGLRPHVLRLARALGLTGTVSNTGTGVSITARGQRAPLAAFEDQLVRRAPPQAVIEHIDTRTIDPATVAEAGFEITHAAANPAPGRRPSLPPDLGVCSACLADVADPESRFFGYAFTSCTDCGPRYSIARALPFDREHTSMAEFPLCAACRADFDDPADRRCHAQTIACPACGPRLTLERPGAAPEPTTAAALAAHLLTGSVVGVKGVGGFHVMCDATNAEAVGRLRAGKHRDEKPFAVLVADLAAAARLAEVDAESAARLSGPERPIVLLPSRGGALAAGVCGPSHRVGVMLPATPLHALVAHEAGRPLVMTSANPSGAPIARTDAEARAALSPWVDALVLHDREVVRRAEDAVYAGRPGRAPQILRRARGQAPRPIRLPFPSPEPVLAVGGHLKVTACVVVGDEAWLTPYLGDLETEEGLRVFAEEVERFEAMLGVRAEVVAHDLHPDYATTQYALGRSARRHIAVQHHRAHALAGVAELHPTGPLLAGVFDGTGDGGDGTAWGGEVLRITDGRADRLATLHPLPLAGGERAVRSVWRVALAALRETYGPAEAEHIAARLPCFVQVPAQERRVVGRMLDTGAGIGTAHGLGRWFDAFGALILGVSRAGFEGDVATRLEEACDGDWTGDETLPAHFDTARGLEIIDPRTLVREVVADLFAGVAPGQVAARVHATFARGLADALSRQRGLHGLNDVLLTGGALQNRRLAADLERHLSPARVLMPRAVPVNDAGLALGQAMAAVFALTSPTTPRE